MTAASGTAVARVALWRVRGVATGAWWIVLALAVAGAAMRPEFLTADNLANLFRQAAPLAIVALGQTIVIVAGGIDLSVGLVMGLVTVVATLLMGGSDAGIPLAIAATVGIALAVGLANGLMITRTGIDPLLQTFGMLAILQGVIFLITDRTAGQAAPGFTWLARGSVAGIPVPAIAIALLAAVAAVLLSLTPAGRSIRAVGSHARNARRAGLAVTRTTLLAYLLSAGFAAAAGLVLAARLGTGYPLAGAGYEIDSIVAVVLGGTALTGGRGGILRTLGGVAALALADNVLNLAGISSYTQQVVKGALVVLVVVAAARSGRRPWEAAA